LQTFNKAKVSLEEIMTGKKDGSAMAQIRALSCDGDSTPEQLVEGFQKLVGLLGGKIKHHKEKSVAQKATIASQGAKISDLERQMEELRAQLERLQAERDELAAWKAEEERQRSVVGEASGFGVVDAYVPRH
jgi:phage shock protein A